MTYDEFIEELKKKSCQEASGMEEIAADAESSAATSVAATSAVPAHRLHQRVDSQLLRRHPSVSGSAENGMPRRPTKKTSTRERRTQPPLSARRRSDS